MQSEHANGLPPAARTKPSKKSKSPLKLKCSSPVKTKHGVATGLHPVTNDIQIYDDDVELDVTPYIVRKDRLVQELESSLAEMDDQISSSTRLQEQKIQVEEERNSLLKEIEGTVTEIQNHVLNARELEIEKKAIEAECSGLKSQVQDLRNLLGSKTFPENGLNHVGFNDHDESLQSELDRAHLRCHTLEKDVQKLRLANEKLWLQNKTGKNAGLDNMHKLRQDNAELEKLLQLAEESEDNIARELATCHQTMAEMNHKEEELQQGMRDAETAQAQTEMEGVELQGEVERLKDEVAQLQDSSNVNTTHKESSENDTEELVTALRKMELKCRKLEQDNAVKQKQVTDLEAQVNNLMQQAAIDADEIAELKNKSSDAVQPLRPAMEKLNKENAALQESLDNAETELNALKVCLEEERLGKTANANAETDLAAKTDETPVKAEKTKKSKFGKGTLTKKSKKNKSGKDEEDGDELEALRKERNDLRNECLALSETVTKVASEKRTMETELEIANNEKQERTAETEQLKVSIEKLGVVENEKRELDDAHTKLIEIYSDVSEKLESSNQKIVNANKQLEKVKEERDSLQNVCKEFQESINSIKTELENVRRDVEAKNNEIKILRKKHEDEKRRLIGMKDGGDKELSKLRAELNDISDKLPGVMSDNLSAAVEQLIKDLNNSTEKCDQLEKAKSDVETRVGAAEKHVRDLEQDSAKANDMAMEKSIELSRMKRSLEKKIEKLSKENAELRKKLGEHTPQYPASPRIASPRISPIVIEKTQTLESEPRVPSPREAAAQRGPSQNERTYSEVPHSPRELAQKGPRQNERTYFGVPHSPRELAQKGISQNERMHSPREAPAQKGASQNERRYSEGTHLPSSREAPAQKGPIQLSPKKERTSSEGRYSVQGFSNSTADAPRVLPYNIPKRKSLDDVLFRDKQLERNAREPPPYKEWSVPTSQPPGNCQQARPQSGSVVTVVAGTVPQRHGGAVLVNRVGDGYHSLPRERRRSHGDQWEKRTTAYEGRYPEGGHVQQSGGDPNSAFQVVGYRRPGKVLQEHYV